MYCPYLINVPFQKWLFLIQKSSKFRGVEYKNRTIIECIKNKSLNTLGMRLRLLKICSRYFFSIPKPEYAYKRYAYKKKHVVRKLEVQEKARD